MKTILKDHLNAPIDALIRYFRTKLVIPLIQKNKAICDIGCSDNPFLLKKISANMRKCVGLDQLIQNPVIENNIELRPANLNQIPLPLKNDEFDIITLLAVIEHLHNPELIVNECFRALTNGGKIIITTPCTLSKPILEILAKLHIISYEEIFDHKHYFKKSELISVLKKAGFKNIKISYSGLNILATAFKN